jgi:hypothetical protein
MMRMFLTGFMPGSPKDGTHEAPLKDAYRTKRKGGLDADSPRPLSSRFEEPEIG